MDRTISLTTVGQKKNGLILSGSTQLSNASIVQGQVRKQDVQAFFVHYGSDFDLSSQRSGLLNVQGFVQRSIEKPSSVTHSASSIVPVGPVHCERLVTGASVEVAVVGR